MDMNLSKLQEIVEDREAWGATDHGVTKIVTWTPMASVSIGEAEADITLQNIPAPSLQGETGEG